jgi:hypothetical protein
VQSCKSSSGHPRISHKSQFYRPAFHRQHFGRLADLNAQFQGWLQHYNTRRRNHGDFMRGRTPFAVMEAHLS